jgi:hypothetical protein
MSKYLSMSMGKSGFVKPEWPVVAEGVAPTLTAWSQDPATFVPTLCMARKTRADRDRRWSVSVTCQWQCGDKVAAGGLCGKCIGHKAKSDAGTAGCHPSWYGLITEEPPAYAELFWGGVYRSKHSKRVTPVWSEVARAKGARPRLNAVHWPAAPAAAAAAAAAAALPTGTVPTGTAAAGEVEVEGELKLIDGTLYMVRQGNVYDYDELTERSGDFCGRLTAEETIDTDGEEVAAPAPVAPAKAPLMGPWETAAKKMAETFAAAAAAAQGAVEKAAKDTAEKKAARTAEMAQLKEQLAAASKELGVLRAFAEKVRGSLPV